MLSCFVNSNISEEEKDNILIDIIEGRKKITGINEFELVEDNKKIRSIKEELENRKRQKLRDRLIKDK